MAEEEQVSGRREGLIRNCSPCSDKGNEKSAVNYCFMCETFFCQDCTEQHNSLLSKHRVTEIESDKVGEHAVRTFQAEPCPQHGRALNLYCKQHDSISCDDCIYREHISCKEVVYLPTSAQDAIKNVDVKEIKSKLRRTIEQLKSIKIMQQETVTSLVSDRETCLQEIDAHHKELLDLLERIVQSSKDKVERTFERFSAGLKRHHQEVEKCLVDLEPIDKCLERNQGNDFPLFVVLKKCQNQMKTTEEVSTYSLDDLNVRGFSVDVDGRLHNLLNELESLVTVLNKAPVQVKKIYKVDVSCKWDESTCIRGSCVLSDGSILLTDDNNQMLKHVDQHSLKVKNQCQIQYCRDVCIINNSEVAVAQENKTVTIVSVSPRLTPIRTIRMDHFCGYIGYSQGELFITDRGNSLHIYNMGGSLLRTITTDPSGQDIFSLTRHVMISAALDRVYIADQDRGVVILDREGQVQDKLVSDKIRGTWGLCPDGLGGLFVCGFKSNNVVHMSADGQILTEVLTSSDGLMHPMSVCYDKVRKRLIVTQNDSKQIHVCEMK